MTVSVEGAVEFNGSPVGCLCSGSPNDVSGELVGSACYCVCSKESEVSAVCDKIGISLCSRAGERSGYACAVIYFCSGCTDYCEGKKHSGGDCEC